VRGRAHIELREHLVALPAELGANRAGLVVEARVHDARVALGRALAHVVRCLQHDDRRSRLRQFASDGGTDAAGADDGDVVRAIGLDCRVARHRAWARRVRRLLIAAACDVELGWSFSDRDPISANIGASLAVHLAFGDALGGSYRCDTACGGRV